MTRAERTALLGELKLVCVVFTVTVIFGTHFAASDKSADVIFQFPEYDYKESSKNVSCCCLSLNKKVCIYSRIVFEQLGIVVS